MQLKRWSLSALRAVSSMKAGITLMIITSIVLAIGSTVMSAEFSNTVLFWLVLSVLALNMVLCTIRQAGMFVKCLRGGHTGGLRQGALLCLHLGILLIFAGGMGSACFRQMDYLCLFPGDSATLPDGTGTLTLDDFSIELDENGLPLQYNASVSLEPGDLSTVLRVNEPLRVNGTKYYYCDFIYGIDTDIRAADGSLNHTTLGEGEEISIGAETLTVYQYIPDYKRDGTTRSSLEPDDPRLLYSLTDPEGTDRFSSAAPGVWTDIGAYQIRFSAVRYYVVILAKRDPGLLPVGIGSVFLLLGIALYYGRRKTRT